VLQFFWENKARKGERRVGAEKKTGGRKFPPVKPNLYGEYSDRRQPAGSTG